MQRKIGPSEMAEDEVAIGNGYQRYLVGVLAALPLAVAGFADIKWVVAVGFALTIALLHECAGRLHDVIIRTRRTNKLLIQIGGDVPAAAPASKSLRIV